MPVTIEYADPLWVVPYGSQSVRNEVLDLLRAGQIDDLERPAAPVVVVDPSRQLPLRMHDLVHPFTLPPIAQDLAHAQTQLAFLEQHLSRLCGDWSKLSQTFIASYFADLRAAVRDNEQTLVDQTGALNGLVELDHWCFAGLMPLPRAHLYLPLTDNTRDYQPADFIMIDFAFWSGIDLIAVIIDNGNTPTGKRKKALDRLAAANGIKLQLINMDLLHNKQPQTLLNDLGPTFTSFWSDLPIPHSPFHGRGINRPLPAG